MKNSYTAFSLGLQLQKQKCERMYFVGRWVMHRIVTRFYCAILQVQKTAECERKRDDSSTTLSNPLSHTLSLSLSLSLYLDDATWVLTDDATWVFKI
jgi:hypothetical protein